MAISDRMTLLDCFLKHESEQRDKVYLIQPLPDGTIAEYTWGEVGDQARRLAAYYPCRWACLKAAGSPCWTRTARTGSLPTWRC